MNKKMLVAGAAILVLTAGLVRAANQSQAFRANVQASLVAQVAAPKSSSVVFVQATPTESAGQEQVDANEPAEANDPAGPDDNVQDGPQNGPENPNEAPETPGK